MESLIGVASFLLHGKVQGYGWEGVGALSLKSFYSGQASKKVILEKQPNRRDGILKNGVCFFMFYKKSGGRDARTTRTD